MSISVTAATVHGCTGKATLPSAAVAARRAKQLRRRYEVKVQPYHCLHCHGWHLGGAEWHGPKRREREAP